MVVKCMGLPEITQRGLFCEYMGNVLAREVGVITPEPALVDVPAAFAESVNGSGEMRGFGLRIQPGIGVGCRFIPGLAPYIPGGSLSEEERSQAANIYGYDLAVQNVDRRRDKPNCAWSGKALIAFDFEMCFSFLWTIVNTDPWDLRRANISGGHLFRPVLRGKTLDWSAFMTALSRLGPQRLDDLTEGMPNDWEEHARRVKNHILGIVAHIGEFTTELRSTLL